MSEQEKVQTESQQAAETGATQENVELTSEQELIARLDAELQQSKAQLAEQHDLMLRIKAEADNIRRRASMDVEKAHKFALEKFAGDLLPVVDNLERALTFINREDEAQKSLAVGVDLTLKSLLDTLAKNGVLQIDPQGEPFSADKHQAMSLIPNPDLPANTVVFVMQKGYELNNRLLRPAMVGVSKAD